MKTQTYEPDKIFFTSDTHFGHRGIIRSCNRPWSSIADMDNELIARWNTMVPEDGTVIHCGDLSFHKWLPTANVLNRLNGRIILVKGNHDHWQVIKRVMTRFDAMSTLLKLKVYDQDAPGGQQYIIACHFPLLVWEKNHHGAWHVHGHSHGSLPVDPKAKRIDVGVDCYDYYPVSYRQLKSDMATREFEPKDNHGKPY